LEKQLKEHGMVRLMVQTAIMLLVGAGSVSLTSGDTYPGPHAFLVASSGGQSGAKILPAKQLERTRSPISWRSTAVLFRLGDDGREKVLWRRCIPNIPVRVVIEDAPDGETPLLVTVGRWIYTSGRPYAHWLVLYGRTGAPIANLALTDVVSKAEIESIVRPPDMAPLMDPVLWWVGQSAVTFRDGSVRIILKSGRSITIDGETGKMQAR
jgi:hypothetical protein